MILTQLGITMIFHHLSATQCDKTQVRILLFPSRNHGSSAAKGGLITGAQSCNMEMRLDLKIFAKARKKTTKMQEMGGMETENSFNHIADD